MKEIYSPPLMAISKRKMYLPCSLVSRCWLIAKKIKAEKSLRKGKCATPNALTNVFFASEEAIRSTCLNSVRDNKDVEDANCIRFFRNHWEQFCNGIPNVVHFDKHGTLRNLLDNEREYIGGNYLRLLKEISSSNIKCGAFILPTGEGKFQIVMFYFDSPLALKSIICALDGALSFCMEFNETKQGEWESIKDNLDGDYGEDYIITGDENHIILAAIATYIKYQDYIIADGRVFSNGSVYHEGIHSIKNTTGIDIIIY